MIMHVLIKNNMMYTVVHSKY